MRLKPNFNVVSIFDINYGELQSLCINTLLFDLDSTLMPSKSGKYPKEVIDFIDKLQKNFLIAVISNNKDEEYIAKVQKQSPFTVIGNANKPSPKVMREFLIKMGRIPSETVMIGDRPLTDILAGKLLGTKTILVDSITRKSEGVLTRIVRKIERLTIKK